MLKIRQRTEACEIVVEHAKERSLPPQRGEKRCDDAGDGHDAKNEHVQPDDLGPKIVPAERRQRLLVLEGVCDVVVRNGVGCQG